MKKRKEHYFPLSKIDKNIYNLTELLCIRHMTLKKIHTTQLNFYTLNNIRIQIYKESLAQETASN